MGYISNQITKRFCQVYHNYIFFPKSAPSTRFTGESCTCALPLANQHLFFTQPLANRAFSWQIAPPLVNQRLFLSSCPHSHWRISAYPSVSTRPLVNWCLFVCSFLHSHWQIRCLAGESHCHWQIGHLAGELVLIPPLCSTQPLANRRLITCFLSQ